MTNEEIAHVIEKLSYHISVIGQTIDYDKYPVEALVVCNDWSKEDLDKAHDIFERWDAILEKGGKINTGEFEQDFNRELRVSYQGLKSIILAFYKNAQWTNVCEAYVDSFGNSPAVEYHSIMRRQR